MNKQDWPSPTDLRCVGGPADGCWFHAPPGDYVRVERRGGAVWTYAPVAQTIYTPPLHALPGESV